MIEFGSGSTFWGPFVQPIRGLIIGLVLIPFRSFLAEAKYGWLYLWLIFVGIGILSTPAGAPCSIEGMVYTKLPLWFHFFGLPEILGQTLVFSVLLYIYMRYPRGIMDILPPAFSVVFQLLAGACFAFIGYAVVSILFAVVGNVDISAEANLSLKVQGIFILPLVFKFAIIMYSNLGKGLKNVKRETLFVIVWLINAVLLAVYQQIVLNGANPAYAVLAPVLPARR